MFPLELGFFWSLEVIRGRLRIREKKLFLCNKKIMALKSLDLDPASAKA
jgi:hypothetical protein